MVCDDTRDVELRGSITRVLPLFSVKLKELGWAETESRTWEH
jgi:hypothetical protein